MELFNDKGKPFERMGRKATGPKHLRCKAAELPKGEFFNAKNSISSVNC